MKIGLLIPCTSRNREWSDIKESYLYKYTIRSLLVTYDKEHTYKLYVGIDKNDKIYDNEDNKGYLIKLCSVMKNVEIEFIYMDDIQKGHLTVMWNKLFKTAFDDDCNYFFQCGDDIQFQTKGWVNTCISTQMQNNDICLTGPLDVNNTRLLTQSFVSRKHMELFGYYFPPEIINWFCDDWINEVYRGLNKFVPLRNYVCNNLGGQPRYDINNDTIHTQTQFKDSNMKMRKKCNELVKRDIERNIQK